MSLLSRSTPLILRSCVVTALLVALLASISLDRAPAVVAAENSATQARVAAETARAETIRVERELGGILLAANRCVETGSLSYQAVASSFGLRSIDSAVSATPSQIALPHNGKGFIGNGKIVGAGDVAGHCDTHDRVLAGGLSPWLAGAIAGTCGIGLRLGSLALMLSIGVPLSVARPVSEALGGFLTGFVSAILINGKVSAKALAAGLFGAIVGVAGGAASRKIISSMTNLPTQTARAIDSMAGASSFQAAADEAAAQLRASEQEWDLIIGDFLRGPHS